MDSTETKALHALLADRSGTSSKDHHARECIQLLHHVYVYGATSGLMLIGNNVKFMYAIELSFSQELLAAYKEVTNYIYQFFDYFYETSLEKFPESEVENALELRNKSKTKKNYRYSCILDKL